MDKSTAIQRLTQIRKLENVRAIPPGTATPQADVDLVRQQLLQVSTEAQADLRTLQDAGWTFGGPEQADADATFDVVLDSDGHLKLAGSALTVKISPDLDQEAVADLLKRMGLKMRRALGFAPNTFLIEAEDGSALNAARLLNDLPEVLYAEPNLVEPIQPRR